MAARGPYRKWISSLQLRIAKQLLPRIARRIGSRTLRRFLQAYERSQDGVAVLGIPHYWAVYYHDGAGAFGPRRANYLVYFADPLANDPRLGGNYPVRFSEWRPLTKEEFRFGLQMNRELGGGFSGPYMFVTKRHRGQEGTKFFEDTHPSRDASQIVPEAFSKLVKQTMGKDLKRSEEISVELRGRG